MKTLNKVIAMMMMLTITSVTPVMAGGWRTSNMDMGGSHFDKVDRAVHHKHFDKHVYRLDVKACTFMVSRHESHLRAGCQGGARKGCHQHAVEPPHTRTDGHLRRPYDITSPHQALHGVTAIPYIYKESPACIPAGRGLYLIG